MSGTHDFRRMDTLGMTPRVWLRCLASAPGPIDGRYITRALGAGALSLVSALATFFPQPEPAVSADELEVFFIIGHWRSGTTFLHHLLASDPRFNALPQSMAVFPHLHGTPLLRPTLRALKLDGEYRRLIDNVLISPRAPMELEYALAALTGESEYLGWTFPRNRRAYLKYLRAEPASLSRLETRRWERAMVDITESLARPRGTVLHKNPASTAAVDGVKRLFPRARFVFIYRDARAVYRSTMKMMRALTEAGTLQEDADDEALSAYVLERYCVLHEAFLRKRVALPPEDLVFVRFESLAQDPLASVRRIYRRFGLEPDAELFAPFIARARGYKRNNHRPIDPAALSAVESRWRPIQRQLDDLFTTQESHP